jgi:hypothetical protein
VDVVVWKGDRPGEVTLDDLRVDPQKKDVGPREV